MLLLITPRGLSKQFPAGCVARPRRKRQENMNNSTEEETITEGRKKLVDDLACLVLAQLNSKQRKSATFLSRAELAAIDAEQVEPKKEKST